MKVLASSLTRKVSIGRRESFALKTGEDNLGLEDERMLISNFVDEEVVKIRVYLWAGFVDSFLERPAVAVVAYYKRNALRYVSAVKLRQVHRT